MKTLKNILLINAISSGVTGLILIILPRIIANIFEVVQSWPFLAIGMFLVLFALLVGYAATRQFPKAALIKFIIILDCLWVIVSFLIMLFMPLNLSLWGLLLTGGVAAWVGLMAGLQYSSLRNLTDGEKVL